MTTTKTQSNTDVYVVHSQEQCAEFDRENAITLDKHDTVTIRLKDFHPNAGFQIDAVKFFHNLPGTGKDPDRKEGDRPAGHWTRSGGPSPNLRAYTVTANGPEEIVIEHVESNPSETRYWYGIEITNGGSVTISLDPELINKPGR